MYSWGSWGRAPLGQAVEAPHPFLDSPLVPGLPAEGHDVGPEPGVGREHAVVTLAVDARGRQETGEARDQVGGRERQHRAALEVGLGEAIDQHRLGALQ